VSDLTLLVRLSSRIIRRVCELPDYTSPDDQPDLVMCTVNELDACIVNALEELPEIARACNSHEKLAAIAERFAGACKECDGKGFIEIPDTCDTSYCEDNTQTFPCEACLDIRDVLASLKEQP
jgi:hypothetical protein